MIICIYLYVFLSVLGLSSSDVMKEEVRTSQKNIFLDSVKPQLDQCETSLGEHGRCVPLIDCPHLRDFVEGGNKDRFLSVIEDFGCGFRKVVFVCCTNYLAMKPLEGLDNVKKPKDNRPAYHLGEYHHHHHHHHLPEFTEPNVFHDNKKPAVGFQPASSATNDRPYEEGSMSLNPESHIDENNKKPVYEEVEEDDAPMGRLPKGTEESKDKATKPLWESSDSIVPQEDYWVWPNTRKSFQKYPGQTTTPDWIVVHQTNRPTGGGFGGLGQSSNQYDIKPNQAGSTGLIEPSAFGSGQSIGGTGTFSSSGQSNSFGSINAQEFGTIDGSSTGNYDNQAFGSGNSGFSSGTSGFGSGLSSIDNQGFGSTRPGSTFSSNQGFNSGNPSQSGLNNQGPQIFGNQRPTNQGFGSMNLGQGFGNERPLGAGFGSERPAGGFNRPNNYDSDNSRPSSARPGSSRPGNRPSNQEEGLFGSGSSFSGGSNNQRPNNQGSNKKPNRGGSNKRRLLPDGRCGAEISDKIIGGEDTKLDEFPWMALLHFTTNSGQDRGYGCGGSLINERYVLTAAHCIKGPSLPDNVVVKTVRLGEYDLTKTRDCVNDVCSPTPLDVAVEEIIPHPDYKPNDKAQYNDIALIRLRKKVPFTTYVSPICIPGDELKKKDYTGKQMVVAGWGKTSNGVNAKSSAIKQKVTLPFVTLEECKPFYNGINIRLRNSQICAGGQRAKDSCQGDSGGPLMTNEVVNGQPSWFATGIVSFGPEDCGIQNIAGVYTRVSEYVDWILDTIKE